MSHTKQIVRLLLVFAVAAVAFAPAFAETAPIADQLVPETLELQGGNSCKVVGPPRDCICPLYYEPVCGCDGVTYSNSCFAACEVRSYTAGACGSAS